MSKIKFNSNELPRLQRELVLATITSPCANSALDKFSGVLFVCGGDTLLLSKQTKYLFPFPWSSWEKSEYHVDRKYWLTGVGADHTDHWCGDYENLKWKLSGLIEQQTENQDCEKECLAILAAIEYHNKIAHSAKILYKHPRSSFLREIVATDKGLSITTHQNHLDDDGHLLQDTTNNTVVALEDVKSYLANLRD